MGCAPKPCTGACCVALPIKTDLAVFAAEYEECGGHDSFMLLDMLVPISDEEARERRKRFGGRRPQTGETSLFYKCRHFNEDTRRCEAYERRPMMCRGYPGYGKPGAKCEHGCDECGERTPAFDLGV